MIEHNAAKVRRESVLGNTDPKDKGVILQTFDHFKVCDLGARGIHKAQTTIHRQLRLLRWLSIWMVHKFTNARCVYT